MTFSRCLYVYKWQGRYYISYNFREKMGNWGRSLIKGIPSRPKKYQAWLQDIRSKYSAIAENLEAAFTISMNNFGENPSYQEAGAKDLARTPGYLISDDNCYDKYIYVVDLDREIFGFDSRCFYPAFYHLSKVPLDFLSLLTPAHHYWAGKLAQNEVHESITTNDIHPIPLTNNPTAAFLKMKPRTVNPRKESRLSRMPAFTACMELYYCFILEYRKTIRQVQDTHIESDFIFRELVFALMCFASCSPAWVRLISVTNMMYKEGKWDDLNYAAILDHGVDRKPKEFISRFLQPYHLEGMKPGSAPNSTSYWFSGALVYLRRDITSRARFQDAIVSAVTKGKADGRTYFDAIIISLKHFILLKFADGEVQHTKRLNLGASIKCEGMYANKNENIESGAATDDTDWADNTNFVHFKILAHFFNATQRQRLCPSSIYARGVFPNEVYEQIISYANMETNIACLEVSRAFREIASETFFMDNGLKLVYDLKGKPILLHDTLGYVGPFEARYPSSSSKRVYRSQWITVFGTPDGSASMLSTIALQLQFPTEQPVGRLIRETVGETTRETVEETH